MEIFMIFIKVCCVWSYSNIILFLLCKMYPKGMTRIIIHGKAFTVTLLMTISWLAQFGSIGKYIIWECDGKEYSIYMPRISNDKDGDIH